MPLPRIAIPMPHSSDQAYSERAIPAYERALEQAGAVTVRILLDRPARDITETIAGCSGVLLPGSNADVDPAKFNAPRSLHTAAADPLRDSVDRLLLEDAHLLRKPLLGICYGLQSLNVFRGGSLIQHIPDFLPEELRAKVNHDAGKSVAIAHDVDIDPASHLAEVITSPAKAGRKRESNARVVIPVNSSHHQSAEAVGAGLRVSARCPDDGIIEAIEGLDSDHFVLAVQWHPERSTESDEPSRAIFRALVQAAVRLSK